MPSKEIKNLIALFAKNGIELEIDNLDVRKATIEAISMMDIKSLFHLLEDSFTYNDKSKNEFLSDLEKSFKNFKQLGNTHLEVHKGNCIGKSCDVVSCVGFSFVGNNSRDIMNLIFKEDNSDIFTCHNFTLYDKNIEITSLDIEDFNFDDFDDVPF